ncbi:MAG: c-type cytochrome domain-containing protein [Planctomycetota bacterium]
MQRIASIFVLGCCMTAASLAASEPEKPNYEDHVKPIFREHCFSCHNQNKATNDLALDAFERLMAGGASGEVIEPGDPDSSYLWLLVSHQDEPKMPPNQDKIELAKLDIIKRWIDEGALRDSGSKAVAPKKLALDLAAAVSTMKPEGPPPMPQGLDLTPVSTVARPGAVTALAASPWAPLVAIAGQKQISLYNTDTAELVGILHFPEGLAQDLRFSRNGSLLVVGGGHAAKAGKAVLFDVRTGRRVTEVGDELDSVLAADVSSDQKRVAIGGPTRLLRVFLTSDGSLDYEQSKHTDWLLAVAFSPDGNLLASADRAAGLQIWEAETGTEFLNLEGHKGPVTAVAWRPDSKLVLSSSEDGTVKLWDMAEGRAIRSINAHPTGVTCLSVAHDGRVATGGRDKIVKIWDAAGKQLRALPPMQDVVLEVALNYDGSRVIAGDYSGEVRVSDTATGKQLATLHADPLAK